MKTAILIVAILLVPIIPFLLFGSWLEPAIEAFFESRREDTSPLIFFLAVVGVLAVDIFLPVPSSFVGTLAGSMLGMSLGTLATWVGLNLSCLIGYWTASRWGRGWVERLATRDALQDVTALSNRFGLWGLVASRPFPILAEAAVLLAGLGQMKSIRFWISVLGANLGLAIAYAVLGSMAAENGWLGFALAFSIAVPVALLGGWLFRQKL